MLLCNAQIKLNVCDVVAAGPDAISFDSGHLNALSNYAIKGIFYLDNLIVVVWRELTCH